MGFPVSYPELLPLPRVLLHLVLLLNFIRRILTFVFTALGLGDLLDSPDIPPSAADHLHLSSSTFSYHHNGGAAASHRPASAVLIREALPASKYGDLGGDPTESCAVCLYEFGEAEEVRRLSNCRHVFHRCCLDQWVELGQRTCPLCRTPLIPDSLDWELSLETTSDAGDGELDYGGTGSYRYGDYINDMDHYYHPVEDYYYSGRLSASPDSEPIIWRSASSAPLFS